MPASHHTLSNATAQLKLLTAEPHHLRQIPTRDWGQFFAALVQLLTAILPLILPFFTDPKPTKP